MNVTDRTVHVTKRALAHLLGRLDGALEATLPFGSPACGGVLPFVQPFPWGLGYLIEQATKLSVLNVGQVDRWKDGETLRLPNCPGCAVLWDEAVAQVDPPQYRGTA
jgi:hypothetical protein